MPAKPPGGYRSGSLDLPPAFRAVKLREAGDAFAHATSVAASAGAGTLIHVGRFDLVEFALIIEPDEPLWSIRRIFYAGLMALRDALAGFAPPRSPISFGWPDAIRVNGGLVGGARLAWPKECDEAAPPDWLVFGAMVRRALVRGSEPGGKPSVTALDEEGFDDAGSDELIASWARHFLDAADAWQADGFAGVAKRYLRHLDHGKGGVPDIDDRGDLLIRWPGQQPPDRHLLRDGLAVPTWLDPASGAPGA